jgi:dihydrofolate synthase/folylpolyglutamate synthase
MQISRIDGGTSVDPIENSWDWWHELVNYERRPASLEELKLQRITEILDKIGNPHLPLKCLHVAGTKGKGSVCAYVDSILRKAGYSVGLFTSPHLVEINERFVINGHQISTPELKERVLEIHSASSKIPCEPPTFFEVATCVAFKHFMDLSLDYVVLETGLGGRLDSTNVCRPIACALTSISLDHTKQLGSTVELIAAEKAGILKAGVPAVSGIRTKGPKEVIQEKAKIIGTDLWEIDNQIKEINLNLESNGKWSFDLDLPTRTYSGLVAGLSGRHQIDNASIAIAMIERAGIEVSDTATKHGTNFLNWPGRVEVIAKDPWIILDTAHNTASVIALTEALKDLPASGKKHLVFAASQDKDIRGMLNHLVGRFDTIHLTRYSGGTRAATPSDMLEFIPEKLKKRCIINDNSETSLAITIKNASRNDLICITGSVFLAGELKNKIYKFITNAI